MTDANVVLFCHTKLFTCGIVGQTFWMRSMIVSELRYHYVTPVWHSSIVVQALVSTTSIHLTEKTGVSRIVSRDYQPPGTFRPLGSLITRFCIERSPWPQLVEPIHICLEYDNVTDVVGVEILSRSQSAPYGSFRTALFVYMASLPSTTCRKSLPHLVVTKGLFTGTTAFDMAMNTGRDFPATLCIS